MAFPHFDTCDVASVLSPSRRTCVCFPCRCVGPSAEAVRVSVSAPPVENVKLQVTWYTTGLPSTKICEYDLMVGTPAAQVPLVDDGGLSP
ncbi:hypothetical protein BH09MYX1_BH09MYX1_40580 [soil metagenome]